MTCNARSLAQGCDLPRLEARMLLEHALDKPRAWLLAHDTDPLADDAARTFQALAARRLAGEPMAYILGWREFMGHVFRVNPSVLIPRPDTELLAETAIELVRSQAYRTVLDLGTGSGAIAISIALAEPGASVLATDASAPALAVAKDNAVRLGATIRCLPGNWYRALPRATRVDLIVSNPPYVASDDGHLAQGDLRFEPRGALTDSADGLRDLYRIISGAPACLNAGGALWVEHGWDQAESVRAALAEAGFGRIGSRRDLAGIERISGGYL